MPEIDGHVAAENHVHPVGVVGERRVTILNQVQVIESDRTFDVASNGESFFPLRRK